MGQTYLQTLRQSSLAQLLSIQLSTHPFKTKWSHLYCLLGALHPPQLTVRQFGNVLADKSKNQSSEHTNKHHRPVQASS